MKNCKYLVIGAGIIGLTIARELIKKGHKDIIILEKEFHTIIYIYSSISLSCRVYLYIDCECIL